MTEVSNAVLADALGEIEPQSIAERVILRIAAGRLRDTPSVSDSAGWIKWGGGDCPVDPGQKVDVELKVGTREKGHPAESYRWSNLGRGSDIVAYRLV